MTESGLLLLGNSAEGRSEILALGIYALQITYPKTPSPQLFPFLY